MIRVNRNPATLLIRPGWRPADATLAEQDRQRTHRELSQRPRPRGGVMMNEKPSVKLTID
jgi:hypothetical protein